MKKGLRIAAIALLFTLLVIQLFPGQKPEVMADAASGDIHEELLIDQNVSYILRSACYDCHSNETVYPWYSGVAPISWLVLHDIKEGRGELNFSEWTSYDLERKHHKLEELIEEVEEGEMPMKIYTVMHRAADLTEEQKNEVISWARSEMARLKPEEGL